MTWAPQSEADPYEHRITRIDLYAHADAVSDRTWLTTARTIADALGACDRLPEPQSRPAAPPFDWSAHTIEHSPSIP
ncbi:MULTISPECIES: hypothetical protein [Clavibacter]|uniref:hypothetical protein n=1 Tax=Clavibacter sp. TaxID=1871044 RepID=UPI00059B71FD|nr:MULTISPECIES: hypothetical protein [Clavibacter]MBD5382460.1 hypothetical protein [Clavibacter sp.]UUK67212.1 hypothetical protein LRE50_15755 [Clavibacter sepedonicus]